MLNQVTVASTRTMCIFGVLIITGAIMTTRQFVCRENKVNENPTSPKQQGLHQVTSVAPEIENTIMINNVHPSYLDFVRSHIADPPREPIVESAKLTNRDYSQLGQSTFIDRRLGGRTNGFFVECGAQEGVLISNSLFFERTRNWTGLLVEASPDRYRKLLSANRKAYSFGGCLSPTGRPELMTYITTEKGLGGVQNYMIQQYVKAVNASKRARRAAVLCLPLSDVLAAISVNHIDYFSLDVDGAELQILKTIDFSHTRIDTLTVEHNEKITAVRKFFAKIGLYREVATIGIGHKFKNGVDLVFERLDIDNN